MNIQAEATFKVDSWDEAIYEEFDDGRKFARATIKNSFEGDLHGEGSLEYLMAFTARWKRIICWYGVLFRWFWKTNWEFHDAACGNVC